MSEFPLLRLDPVILINILENCDSFVIFNLSLCSRKALSCVKKFADERLKSNYVNISFEREPKICLSSPFFEVPWGYDFCCAPIRDSSRSSDRLSIGELNGVPYLYSIPKLRLDDYLPPEMLFFWEDRHQGMQELMKHFLQLFDTAHFAFTVDIHYKHFLETLDMASSLCKQVNSFQSIKVNSNYPGIENPWENVDRVKWLLPMNCMNIQVKGEMLTSEDINGLLKGWIEGAWPRLNFIIFGEVELDFSVILKDIMFSVNEMRKGRLEALIYTICSFNNEEEVSFNICRFDLTIAKVTAFYPDRNDPTDTKKSLRMDVNF